MCRNPTINYAIIFIYFFKNFKKIIQHICVEIRRLIMLLSLYIFKNFKKIIQYIYM